MLHFIHDFGFGLGLVAFGRPDVFLVWAARTLIFGNKAAAHWVPSAFYRRLAGCWRWRTLRPLRLAVLRWWLDAGSHADHATRLFWSLLVLQISFPWRGSSPSRGVVCGLVGLRVTVQPRPPNLMPRLLTEMRIFSGGRRAITSIVVVLLCLIM